MRRGHQLGFSAIYVFLVVLVIGVVGAAGWFVYQHNRVKSSNVATNTKQTTNQQTTTPSPAPAPANQNIVKVPELGIQITVPDSIKDLTYQVSTDTLADGSKAMQAGFSTASLTKLDAQCSAASSPFISLERAEGHFPSNPGPNYRLVKQFLTFYVAENISLAACTTNRAALNALGADQNAFVAAEPTIQQLNN